MEPVALEFLHNGKINRSRFALSLFSSIAAYVLIVAAFPPVMTNLEWAVMLFLVGVVSFGQILSALMRCRDLGRPGWFLLAWFIPVVGMFWVLGELLFRRSKSSVRQATT